MYLEEARRNNAKACWVWREGRSVDYPGLLATLCIYEDRYVNIQHHVMVSLSHRQSDRGERRADTP